MNETITVGFTHPIAHRDGDRTTTKCGRVFTVPGWRDQGMNCPDCYNLPDDYYGKSPRSDTPMTFSRRSK